MSLAHEIHRRVSTDRWPRKLQPDPVKDASDAVSRAQAALAGGAPDAKTLRAVAAHIDAARAALKRINGGSHAR